MPRLGNNLFIVGYDSSDHYQFIVCEFESYNEMSKVLNVSKNTCYCLISRKQPYKNIIYEVIDSLTSEERLIKKKEYEEKRRNKNGEKDH